MLSGRDNPATATSGPKDDVTRLGSKNNIHETGSSNLQSQHYPSASLLPKKRGIARTVRMFGGVIIGRAAEEISRDWAQLPLPLTTSVASADDSSSSDRDEPVAECFDISPPQQLSVEACLKHLQDDEDEDKGIRAEDEGRGGLVPKRPADSRLQEGKRKKICSNTIGDNRPRIVRGDATPRAPQGRAAARAKAAGFGYTSFVSECRLPTQKGLFRMRAYRYHGAYRQHEPVVMVSGDLRDKVNVPVRVHDQCQTSEVRRGSWLRWCFSFYFAVVTPCYGSIATAVKRLESTTVAIDRVDSTAVLTDRT